MEKSMKDGRNNFQLAIWFVAVAAFLTVLSRIAR
jgi:hypothetical protein